MSINGDKGILYIYATTWKPVACLTSNNLNSSLEVIESRTKCFPGVTKKTAGSFDYTIDAEGEYLDTTSVGGDTAKKSHDALFALQQAKTLVQWKIDTEVGNADSIKYYGSAYITDLGATWPVAEVSTFSATLSGDGAVLLEHTVVRYRSKDYREFI